MHLIHQMYDRTTPQFTTMYLLLWSSFV